MSGFGVSGAGLRLRVLGLWGAGFGFFLSSLSLLLGANLLPYVHLPSQFIDLMMAMGSLCRTTMLNLLFPLIE